MNKLCDSCLEREVDITQRDICEECSNNKREEHKKQK